MAELVNPIPQEDLAKLIDAATAKKTADGAALYSELASIATQINVSVNSGAYSVRILHRISDEAKEELEGKGYKVSPVLLGAVPLAQTDIFWSDEA